MSCSQKDPHSPRAAAAPPAMDRTERANSFFSEQSEDPGDDGSSTPTPPPVAITRPGSALLEPTGQGDPPSRRPGSRASSGVPEPGATRTGSSFMRHKRASRHGGQQQWRQNAVRGTEQWLEDHKNIDAGGLISYGLNVDGLTDALQELVAAVLGNTKAIERAKVETGKIYKLMDEQRREMLDMVQHVNSLEVEIQAIKKEVQVVHENKEALAKFQAFRESHEVQVIDLQQECRRLDKAKLDSKSPKLESDARKYALDTVKSFFNIRNKETKEWIEKKVGALQQAFTQELFELSQTVQTETLGVTRKMTALVDMAKADFDGKVREHGECLRKCSTKLGAVFEKLDTIEADVDMQAGNLSSEIERSFKETRLLYTALSLNFTELEKVIPPGWEQLHASLYDMDARRRAEMIRIARLEQRLEGWKVLHDPGTHILKDAHPLQPKWEVADASRVKLIESLKTQAEGSAVDPPERPSSSNKYVPDAAVTMLLSGQVFADFRQATDSLVATVVGQTAEDLKEDLSKEGQRVSKDIKTRVTTQKCLELINEHVGQPFADEKKANAQRFELLEEVKVSHDRLNDMMRSKADVTVLQQKADRSAMVEMFEYVNTKIGVETSDDIVKRNIRQLKAQVDELSTRKLDSDHPDLRLVLEAVKGGGVSAFGGGGISAKPFASPAPAASVSRGHGVQAPSPAAGQGKGGEKVAGGETCMSCFGKTPGPEGMLEDVISRREKDRQVMQEAIHARQMSAGKTNKVQAFKRGREVGGATFDVDNYIDNMAKGLSPTPPPAARAASVRTPA